MSVAEPKEELASLREEAAALLADGGVSRERLADAVRRLEALRARLAPDWTAGLAHAARAALEVARVGCQGELAGARETDEFGLDRELVRAGMPLLHWLYRHYFRVRTTGIEHVPAEGPTLLVANHAGIILWDGAMLAAACDLEHPRPRLMRAVYLSFFARMPFVAPLLARFGQVQALPENTQALLSRGELVGVFPEGTKGAGKLFRDRYRLRRFGRGGFIRSALLGRAKLVPVAIVGAEETYPMFWRLGGPTGRFLGLPFFPVTATFPWLGPLGLVPFPARFRIRFHEPTDYGLVDPDRARDFTWVMGEVERVRGTIQRSLDELRIERGHPYLGH